MSSKSLPRFWARGAGIVLLVFLLSPSWSWADAGDLDPTFGDGGKVLTDYGLVPIYARDVAVQDDGRIVVVGGATLGSRTSMVVLRYLPDGRLDGEFGDNGVAMVDFGQGSAAFGVAIHPSFGIVVAGATTGTGIHFALARLNWDGSLDTSFGTDGKVTDKVAYYDMISEIAFQPDGKIVAAGRAGSDFCLVRYHPDGLVDESFGESGRIIGSNPNYDVAESLAVHKDGRIVVSGQAWMGDVNNIDFVLMRFDPDGLLDTTFGTDGTTITDFENQADYGRSVVLQSDGKVVVAGLSAKHTLGFPSQYSFALARYDEYGVLDPTFGEGGLVRNVFSEVSSLGPDVTDVAAQADGKLIVVGYNQTDFVLARYSPDGTLDESFGTSGWVTTDFCTQCFDRAHGVAVQQDGRIVVAGSSSVTFGKELEVALARYEWLDESQCAIIDLTEGVEELIDSGILTEGRGNSLIVKLDAAFDSINSGNYADAIDELQAFINQVNAFVRSAILSMEQGQTLIAAAEDILDDLRS